MSSGLVRDPEFSGLSAPPMGLWGRGGEGEVPGQPGLTKIGSEAAFTPSLLSSMHIPHLISGQLVRGTVVSESHHQGGER